MTNVLTAKELQQRLGDACEDAKIFVYTGSDGTKVQAECAGYHGASNHEPQIVMLVSAPSCVPQAGGPAI